MDFDLKDLKPEDIVVGGSSPLVQEEDAVQEPETEEVDVQEPSAGSEEVAEGGEEEVSEEVVEEPVGVEAQTEIPQHLKDLDGLLQEDEYIKNALEYYKKNKTLKPYLDALSVDYNSIDDTQLLRLKYERENPDLDPKVRERLFNKEVLGKYTLDEDLHDDDEVEIAKALLKRDANRVRQELIKEQQDFVPKNVPQAPSQEEVQAQIAAQREQIAMNLKNYLESATIKIDAEEPLNYEIGDTKKLVDYALDSQTFFNEFIEGESVNWDKWAKVVSFMQDPDKFIDEMIKHGKSMGKKSFEEELRNPEPLNNSREVDEDDLGDSPFDNPEGFLKFALKNKK